MLQVYYSDDVRNALLAAEQASARTAGAGQVPPEYQQGFIDALATIALAFGLVRQEPEPMRWPGYAVVVGGRDGEKDVVPRVPENG